MKNALTGRGLSIFALNIHVLHCIFNLFIMDTTVFSFGIHSSNSGVGGFRAKRLDTSKKVKCFRRKIITGTQIFGDTRPKQAESQLLSFPFCLTRVLPCIGEIFYNYMYELIIISIITDLSIITLQLLVHCAWSI